LNRRAGQSGTIKEHIVSKVGDAVGNRDVHQARTGRERIITNIGNAVRNNDVGQPGAKRERINPDASDREAIGRAGDSHHPARPGVAGEGDCAVIGRESELGLRGSGQRQEQQQRFDGFRFSPFRVGFHPQQHHASAGPAPAGEITRGLSPAGFPAGPRR